MKNSGEEISHQTHHSLCMYPCISWKKTHAGKGFRTVLAKRCHFGMRIIWSQRQLKPCRLNRNFNLFLKEFKLGALPIIGVIIRNKILRPMCRAGQASNY